MEDRGQVGAFEIGLSRQRIDLLVPLNGTVLYNCGELTWMRGIWPGQTLDKEPLRWVKEFQLGFNLNEVFNYRVRFGHTELMLPPESMVRPAAYHFDAENPGGLVGQPIRESRTWWSRSSPRPPRAACEPTR